jgi:hypothetical protein
VTATVRAMPSKPSKASTCPGQCGHRVRLCRFGRPPEVPMRAPRRRKQTARNRPKREQFGRRSAQTRLPLHGRVAGVDRTAAQSWLCESPAVADAVALAARPEHQRREPRRRWLLRRASDSQMRLQVTAGTASKHFARSRNRGKGGSARCRSRRRDRRRPRDAHLWRGAGKA